MNSESVNDAELEAFLKGEDALASALQAMQQAAPSAELDAAIMAQAEAMMAQERPPLTRPVAANDAGAAPARRPAQPAQPAQPALRWRAPVGIAAALIAGVLAQQSWQSETDIERLARQPAAAPAPVLEAAPSAQPPAVVQAPPAAADREAPAAPKQASRPQATRKVAPTEAPTSYVSAQAAMPAPSSESAPAPQLVPAPSSPEVIAAPAPAPSSRDVTAAPPPAPVLRYAPAQAFAPAPAPAPAPSAVATPAEAAGQVQILARRSRIAVPPAPAPASPAAVAKQTVGDADPATWLAAIDEMLRAGLRRDTLEEWDKFRAAYPDYPVPAATLEQINALRR